MKIAIVANSPAPYRNAVYDLLSGYDDVELKVIYSTAKEANRTWENEEVDHNFSYLPAFSLPYRDQFLHFNAGVFAELKSTNADVVVTTGFGATMLTAFLWSQINRRKHICFTDGTIDTERKLTALHRFLRRSVFERTAAFIGASRKSDLLYSSYGIADERIFRSCLCIQNERYGPPRFSGAEYDLLFAGQFIDRKFPQFTAQVAQSVAEKRGKASLLMVGDGPLQEETESILRHSDVQHEIAGFIQPALLPQFYRKARILLFPTKEDAWGVVANEACASGVPVLTTASAGCSGELIVNDESGFVLDLDVETWASKICLLLDNPAMLHKMSDSAIDRVANYTPERAAHGIFAAAEFALAN